MFSINYQKPEAFIESKSHGETKNHPDHRRRGQVKEDCQDDRQRQEIYSYLSSSPSIRLNGGVWEIGGRFRPYQTIGLQEADFLLMARHKILLGDDHALVVCWLLVLLELS